MTNSKNKLKQADASLNSIVPIFVTWLLIFSICIQLIYTYICM